MQAPPHMLGGKRSLPYSDPCTRTKIRDTVSAVLLEARDDSGNTNQLQVARPMRYIGVTHAA